MGRGSALAEPVIGPAGGRTRWLACPGRRGLFSVLNFKKQIHVRILAARLARGLRLVVPRKKREQGMPDARCTRGLACKMGNENAHEHTGSAEALRHSLRNGFTAYNALSPATNSSCHRRRRISGIPAPGRAGMPPPA